ncbi:hypothetical protein GCM10022199_04480 [Marihabitans asiaticum]|uniref:Phage integrase family protein n=1 Tax=Marihabitans asiaticum TaxID=415218 RepID=A0A560WEB4_9MICO|nr:hypothetical protein [Marihabitans asiaticum]TWD15880.1 hypothetical protein FB557_1416 [Marihabitans asiaticum]
MSNNQLVARRKRTPRTQSGAASLRAREEALTAAPEPLPAEYLEWLRTTYKSKKVTETELARMRPAIVEAMTHCPGRGMRSMELRTSQVVTLLMWAKQVRGLTDVAQIFTREHIEDFCSTALSTVSEKTRSDYRGRLRPIADSLHPETAPEPAPVLRRKDVQGPYTPDEMNVIRRAILVQPTDELVRQLCVCVGLGVGAGINSSELKTIRTSDVHLEADGAVRVEIRGDKARTLWVHRDWEDVAARGVQGRAANALLLGENPNRRNVTSNLFQRAHLYGDVPELSQDRLRATWIVGHLNRATPFSVLCHAAGLSSTRALFDLLEFVTVAPAKGALRGEGR